MIQPVDWEAGEPADYLGADDIIESDNPAVTALAGELRSAHPGDTDFTKAAYEWVRDKIAHSYDAHDPEVTLSASEVIAKRVGLCYAKSNMPAAVLRSGSIPAALCYQRLGNPEEDRG